MKRLNLPGIGASNAGGYHAVSVPQSDYMRGTGPQRDNDLELGDLGSDEFYDEVASIRESVRALESSIQTLQTRQVFSLANSSPELTAQIAALTSQLSGTAAELRGRVARLGKKVGRDEARRGHWDTLKGGLQRSVQRWQMGEMAQRERVRERVARQYKIVKPDVTDAEVKAVVEGGTADQIFQQAVAGSLEEGAQAALSEATDRREEVLRIETTLTELAQLFTQVAELVARQDSQIASIEETTREAEIDTADGIKELGIATVSAAAARHKRKLCAAFFGVILLILIIIIVVEVKGASHNPPTNSTTTTHTDSSGSASRTPSGSSSGSSSGSASLLVPSSASTKV